MKKLLLSLIFILFLIPTVVLAEDKVEIKSITFVEKSENTKVVEEASTDGEKINLNLVFYEKDDYATYKVVVYNPTSTSLYINDKYFNNGKEYVYYGFEYSDGSNIVKPGEEKTFNMKVTYNKEVPKESFRSGKYDLSNTDPLILSDKLISIPNTLKNLGLFGICLVVILIPCIIGGLYVLFKNRRNICMNILILSLLLIIIPKSADALFRIDIPVNSKVIIKLIKDNPCTYDGEMVIGAQYTNGQYLYNYKPSYTYWDNGSQTGYYEGWGVVLADKESTDPVTTKLCTSINDKPIVSMIGTFSSSKASMIDLSSFDSSNAVVMTAMFSGVGSNKTEAVVLKDIEYLDTSNVTKFDYIFSGYGSNSPNVDIELDLSKWDVSKATNIDYAFYNFGNNSHNVKLNVSSWTLNVPNSISNVFVGIGQQVNKLEIDLNNWDINKASKFYYTFNGAGYKANEIIMDFSNWKLNDIKEFDHFFFVLGSECHNIKLLGLETWDMSNVEDISYMFNQAMMDADEINFDFSSWDVSNIKYFNSFLRYVGRGSKKVKINLSGWKIRDDAVFSDMFGYAFSSVDELELNLSNWDLTGKENVKGLFGACASSAKKVNIDMSGWKTTGMKDLSKMFYDNCLSGSKETTINMSGWDTSQVTNMEYMFYMVTYNGYSDNKPGTATLIGLGDWDTKNVTNMNTMISYNGNIIFDSINVYDTNARSMIYSNKNVKGVVNIYKNPTNYTAMFSNTNYQSEWSITVNYTSEVTEIDNIIATKSSYSPDLYNIVKGELIEG